MKKYLSILVLVVLVTPQVAMAAWWNPFSWGVFQKKEVNVEQLENRIKDLEKKLEETSVKKNVSTTTASPVKVEKPVVKKAEKVVVPVSVVKEVVPEAPKTFVLPSGAVVDGAGNVVSGAPAKDDETIAKDYFNQNKTCAGLRDVNIVQHSLCVNYALGKVDTSRQSSTVSPSLPIVLSRMVMTTPNSVHMEWDTNIPTDSKIFLTQGGSTQVVPSISGRSTHHIVDIGNLLMGVTYNYVIEAINDVRVEKISGVIETEKIVATKLIVRMRHNNFYPEYKAYGGECATVSFSAEVRDQFGDLMKQSVTTTVQDEGYSITHKFDDREIQYLKDGQWQNVIVSGYAPKALSGMQKVNFTSGVLSTSTTLTIVPLVLNSWDYVDAGNGRFRSLSSGGNYDPITHACY